MRTRMMSESVSVCVFVCVLHVCVIMMSGCVCEVCVEWVCDWGEKEYEDIILEWLLLLCCLRFYSFRTPVST